MENYEKFRNLMVMAAADQNFAEEEIQFLLGRVDRWGITEAEFETAMREASLPGAVLTVPISDQDRREFLVSLLDVISIDGDVSPVEKRLFDVVAARLEVSEAELNQLISELR